MPSYSYLLKAIGHSKLLGNFLTEINLVDTMPQNEILNLKKLRKSVIRCFDVDFNFKKTIKLG